MSGPEMGREPKGRSRRASFPWLLLLLFAGSVYAFWVLPRQLPDRPVKVEFVDDGHP